MERGSDGRRRWLLHNSNLRRPAGRASGPSIRWLDTIMSWLSFSAARQSNASPKCPTDRGRRNLRYFLLKVYLFVFTTKSSTEFIHLFSILTCLSLRLKLVGQSVLDKGLLKIRDGI